MSKFIHIVSFDVPFPPDYGGVLDVFLRAKGLKNLGYSVILHCYEYGRGRTHDFSEIADEIHYYDRQTGFKSLLSKLPYIVKSRNSEVLMDRLMQDQHPILLEGQHSTFWVHELNKNNRKVGIRMHNIEWQYYTDLAINAKTTSERLYFRTEARKLKKQELQLKTIPVLCISTSDLDYYQNLGFHALYLPVTIHPDLILKPTEGKESFALYHGNLSVSENEKAIDKLIQENKRSKFHLPVIIAGKNPSPFLRKKIQKQGWECIANPSDAELNELMSSCSLHLLIGFKSAGVKLKVIRALLTGKPCITTPEMVGSSALEKHCEIWAATSPLSDKINAVLATNQEPTNRLEELEMEFGIGKLKSVLQEIGF
jgi:hypothetical protein